jgi:ABC-type branched-subunit amino acid transport system substrate-binding protein
MPIKIGVVVPHSNYIPFLAQDIPLAMELGLTAYPEVEYELCVEPAGYNADKNVLIGRIQDLLVKHRVDTVTAPLNAGVLEHLTPYCSGQQIPLIVNTLGEDIVSDAAQDPYLFINSFNLWETSWMSGYWGGKEFGKTASSLAAFHDGGYGITFSFALGLEAQQGKNIHAAVTHRGSRVEDPSEAIQAAAASRPDFIMGFYSGKESTSFLRAYHRLGLHNRIPLVGLPFMVDEQLLQELGESALGVKSLSCWRTDTDDHRRFVDTFTTRTGRPVHSYALLAYETGHLLARAVQHIGTDRPVTGHLAEALQAVQYRGPRGVIRFDAKSREVATAVYLREVVRGEDGHVYNKVIDVLEKPPLLFEQLVLARKNLTKQGWMNPYLAA